MIAFAISNEFCTDDRWTELTLYRTIDGNYIAKSVEYTTESDKYSACVCSSLSKVIEFFGYSPLSKRIYSDLGIDSESSQLVE